MWSRSYPFTRTIYPNVRNGRRCAGVDRGTRTSGGGREAPIRVSLALWLIRLSDLPGWIGRITGWLLIGVMVGLGIGATVAGATGFSGHHVTPDRVRSSDSREFQMGYTAGALDMFDLIVAAISEIPDPPGSHVMIGMRRMGACVDGIADGKSLGQITDWAMGQWAVTQHPQWNAAAILLAACLPGATP